MCKGNEVRKPEDLSRKLSIDFSKTSILIDDPIKKDLIAQFTQVTKDCIQQSKFICKYVQSWTFYRHLKGKSQPAHVLTILSVIFIAKFLQFEVSKSSKSSLSNESSWMKLLYLGCFAAHIGAQIWMTFVSGLALYFNLPRHVFGSVQKILFPKYFSINAALSLVILCTFVKCQSASDSYFQILFLVLCFFIELVIRLYLTPILVKLMTVKISMEQKAGVGSEVGKFEPGNLSLCPRYVGIHYKFRKVHMAIAMGNMLSMGLTFAHLFYLSNKICI